MSYGIHGQEWGRKTMLVGWLSRAVCIFSKMTGLETRPTTLSESEEGGIALWVAEVGSTYWADSNLARGAWDGILNNRYPGTFNT